MESPYSEIIAKYLGSKDGKKLLFEAINRSKSDRNTGPIPVTLVDENDSDYYAIFTVQGGLIIKTEEIKKVLFPFKVDLKFYSNG